MLGKNSKTNHFKLGWTVRDMVSGLTGTAVTRLEHLNGCVHYGIQPKVADDGKKVETEYVDSQQIEKVDDGILAKVVPNNTGAATGKPNGFKAPKV